MKRGLSQETFKGVESKEPHGWFYMKGEEEIQSDTPVSGFDCGAHGRLRTEIEQ